MNPTAWTHLSHSPDLTDQILLVSAGVISDHHGHILIARRSAHPLQGDIWEFPGGKLEPGEDPFSALCRELREEIGIEVIEATPLITIRHRYSHQNVRLFVWRVERFTGKPYGVQGQPLRWVTPSELRKFSFLEANWPIVTAARLPDYYAIAQADSVSPEINDKRFYQYKQMGITLVRLRSHCPDTPYYTKLVEETIILCKRYGILLLLDGNPDRVQYTKAAGLHLRAKELMRLDRRPLDHSYWIAASCHTSQELQHACAVGVDFAVLGPVYTTQSHPGMPGIGWDTFAELTEYASLPIYALGGLRMSDRIEAKQRGAQGIAAIRGFLEDFAL